MIEDKNKKPVTDKNKKPNKESKVNTWLLY